MSIAAVLDLQDFSHRGLTRAVTAAIEAGLLREGERLPPIRSVAKELQLSPTTVSAAWSTLVRRGVIRTDGRRGTTVATSGTHGPTRYRRALESRAGFVWDVATGMPDPALLPALDGVLQRVPQESRQHSYLDDPVLPQLREALRGSWPYDAEELTVTDGAMDAMDLICAVFLEPGDIVAVEHPCFPPLLDLLEACGIRTRGLAMDEQGLTVAAARRAVAARVRAVFLQPRAHNPTGICMSGQRAVDLADVFADTQILIVEDDSAGDVASSPAVSLGRFIPQRVMHIRSFSKSHGPDLRLAAISGPADRIAALSERRLLGQGWTSRLLQAVLFQLLCSDDTVAAIDHARDEYARRRAAVVSGLADRGVPVIGTDGLNIWLPVQDEAAALVQLAGRGIAAAAGSPFHVLPDDAAHLRVTTGLVGSDHAQFVQDLADAAAALPWAGPR